MLAIELLSLLPFLLFILIMISIPVINLLCMCICIRNDNSDLNRKEVLLLSQLVDGISDLSQFEVLS